MPGRPGAPLRRRDDGRVGRGPAGDRPVPVAPRNPPDRRGVPVARRPRPLQRRTGAAPAVPGRPGDADAVVRGQADSRGHRDGALAGDDVWDTWAHGAVTLRSNPTGLTAETFRTGHRVVVKRGR